MRAIPLLVLLAVPCAAEEPKKPEKKDVPVTLIAQPLSVAVGKKASVTLRGRHLDTATEVKTPAAGVTPKVVGKGKANVPNRVPPERVGDTQVEFELELPADFDAETLELTVVTPSGTSEPFRLHVDRADTTEQEKEPNNGFRQAKSLPTDKMLIGTIGQGQDVDVFRLDGRAGASVVFEVHASRIGSALDAVLVLYDETGRQVAAADDTDGADPRLTVTFPRTGTFFLTILDAHDQGGPMYGYRLVVRPTP